MHRLLHHFRLDDIRHKSQVKHRMVSVMTQEIHLKLQIYYGYHVWVRESVNQHCPKLYMLLTSDFAYIESCKDKTLGFSSNILLLLDLFAFLVQKKLIEVEFTHHGVKMYLTKLSTGNNPVGTVKENGEKADRKDWLPTVKLPGYEHVLSIREFLLNLLGVKNVAPDQIKALHKKIQKALPQIPIDFIKEIEDPKEKPDGPSDADAEFYINKAMAVKLAGGKHFLSTNKDYLNYIDNARALAIGFMSKGLHLSTSAAVCNAVVEHYGATMQEKEDSDSDDDDSSWCPDRDGEGGGTGVKTTLPKLDIVTSLLKPKKAKSKTDENDGLESFGIDGTYIDVEKGMNMRFAACSKAACKKTYQHSLNLLANRPPPDTSKPDQAAEEPITYSQLLGQIVIEPITEALNGNCGVIAPEIFNNRAFDEDNNNIVYSSTSTKEEQDLLLENQRLQTQLKLFQNTRSSPTGTPNSRNGYTPDTEERKAKRKLEMRNKNRERKAELDAMDDGGEELFKTKYNRLLASVTALKTQFKKVVNSGDSNYAIVGRLQKMLEADEKPSRPDRATVAKYFETESEDKSKMSNGNDDYDSNDYDSDAGQYDGGEEENHGDSNKPPSAPARERKEKGGAKKSSAPSSKVNKKVPPQVPPPERKEKGGAKKSSAPSSKVNKKVPPQVPPPVGAAAAKNGSREGEGKTNTKKIAGESKRKPQHKASSDNRGGEAKTQSKTDNKQLPKCAPAVAGSQKEPDPSARAEATRKELPESALSSVAESAKESGSGKDSPKGQMLVSATPTDIAAGGSQEVRDTAPASVDSSGNVYSPVIAPEKACSEGQEEIDSSRKNNHPSPCLRKLEQTFNVHADGLPTEPRAPDDATTDGQHTPGVNEEDCSTAGASSVASTNMDGMCTLLRDALEAAHIKSKLQNQLVKEYQKALAYCKTKNLTRSTGPGNYAILEDLWARELSLLNDEALLEQKSGKSPSKIKKGQLRHGQTLEKLTKLAPFLFAKGNEEEQRVYEEGCSERQRLVNENLKRKSAPAQPAVVEPSPNKKSQKLNPPESEEPAHDDPEPKPAVPLAAEAKPAQGGATKTPNVSSSEESGEEESDTTIKDSIIDCCREVLENVSRKSMLPNPLRDIIQELTTAWYTQNDMAMAIHENLVKAIPWQERGRSWNLKDTCCLLDLVVMGHAAEKPSTAQVPGQGESDERKLAFCKAVFDSSESHVRSRFNCYMPPSHPETGELKFPDHLPLYENEVYDILHAIVAIGRECPIRNTMLQEKYFSLGAKVGRTLAKAKLRWPLPELQKSIQASKGCQGIDLQKHIEVVEASLQLFCRLRAPAERLRTLKMEDEAKMEQLRLLLGLQTTAERLATGKGPTREKSHIFWKQVMLYTKELGINFPSDKLKKLRLTNATLRLMLLALQPLDMVKRILTKEELGDAQRGASPKASPKASLGISLSGRKSSGPSQRGRGSIRGSGNLSSSQEPPQKKQMSISDFMKSQNFQTPSTKPSLLLKSSKKKSSSSSLSPSKRKRPPPHANSEGWMADGNELFSFCRGVQTGEITSSTKRKRRRTGNGNASAGSESS